MSDEPMTDKPDPFIVKITSPTGHKFWLTAPNVEGIRTLGIRDQAEVFTTEMNARVAIATMPQPFKQAGLVFSIEPSQ
jgi:hypothetical protein